MNPDQTADAQADIYMYRGLYISADVLLKLLNKLRNNNKMRGFAEHFIIFPQQIK